MPGKKYRAKLTDEERDYLVGLISSGAMAARKASHARILLHADEGKVSRVSIRHCLNEETGTSGPNAVRPRSRVCRERLTGVSRLAPTKSRHWYSDETKNGLGLSSLTRYRF